MATVGSFTVFDDEITLFENPTNTTPAEVVGGHQLVFFGEGDLDGLTLDLSIQGGTAADRIVLLTGENPHFDLIGPSLLHDGVVVAQVSAAQGSEISVDFNANSDYSSVHGFLQVLVGFQNTSDTPSATRTILFEFLQPGLDTIAESLLVKVIPENDLPKAGNDLYDTAEDLALTVAAAAGVLRNDTDPDRETLRVASFTQPGNGRVALNPDGSFTYTPAPDFSGTDRFAYTVADAAGAAATATATIEVAPRDEPVVRSGGDGRDILVGAGGGDVLSGAGGADELDGLGGDDLLTGGGGPDRFVIRANSGQDRVTDFSGEDTVVLPAGNSALDGFAEVLAAIADTAQGALLDLGGGNTVLFEGVAKASFTANDFAFA